MTGVLLHLQTVSLSTVDWLENAIVQSMSRAGCPYDNGVVVMNK